MKTYLLINTVGLALDMTGVVLIFFFGIAKILETGGHSLISFEGRTDKEELKRERRYKRFSKLGIILIFVGFLLQIVSNFLK